MHLETHYSLMNAIFSAFFAFRILSAHFICIHKMKWQLSEIDELLNESLFSWSQWREKIYS